VRLALAGVVAILVFATIGQLSHHGGVSLGGYAADTLPFLFGWLLRAVVLSHYRWSELSFWVVALVFVGALSGVLLLAARRVA
jgi:hypothetical protein